jgi:hypothetical protein
MSVTHIDRRAGSKTRHANEGNPLGLDRKEEKLSEYFLPERGELKVKRYELLSILTMIEKGHKNMRLRSRLWRWLKARVGSGPVEANPQPEKGVTVLGVEVGADPVSEAKPAEGRGNESE